MQAENTGKDEALPHESVRQGTIEEAVAELDKQIRQLSYQAWRLDIENIVLRRKMEGGRL